jgi:hypothetical protein
MEFPGTFYNHSGKFKPIATIFTTIIFSILAALMGALYAKISSINPIIYFNFLILAVAFIILFLLLEISKVFNESRNRFVNFVTTLIICLSAWYANWVIYYNHGFSKFSGAFFQFGDVINFVFNYAGKHKMTVSPIGGYGLTFPSGLMAFFYLCEFCIFLFPIYFCFQTTYYCEGCRTFYMTKLWYIKDVKQFLEYYQHTADGRYGFIGEMKRVRSLSLLGVDIETKPLLIKIAYHYCKKCQKNSMVDISTVNIQYNQKKQIVLVNEDKLIKGVYIDEKTNDALRIID